MAFAGLKKQINKANQVSVCVCVCGELVMPAVLILHTPASSCASSPLGLVFVFSLNWQNGDVDPSSVREFTFRAGYVADLVNLLESCNSEVSETV